MVLLLQYSPNSVILPHRKEVHNVKTIKLSKIILKYMVQEYVSNGRDIFFFEDLKKIFLKDSSEQSINYLCKALYILEHDGFVSISPADDVAYRTVLLPNGIRHCEENTLIKKCYTLLKELRNLFP